MMLSFLFAIIFVLGIVSLSYSSHVNEYNEEYFRFQIDKSLSSIKQILDINKNPTIAQNVPHQYDDKYKLGNNNETTILTYSTSHIIDECYEHYYFSYEYIN